VTPEELRSRRAALGLSQLAIAERLGIPRNTWARWERGELAVEKPVLLGLALEALAARAGGERAAG